MVAAWLLPEILDASPQTLQGGPAGVTPWRSWTTHTLPVTAVAVGSGGVNAIVVSASLDHTVKIHSLGAGVLLCTFVLPRPLTSLALDPGEHAVYAGSSYGNVYEISLIRPPSADGHNNAEWSEMPQGLSHSKSVSSLALTTDGQLLISGSEDSSVKVWDLGSKQVIRTLGSSGSNGVQQGPVSNVVVLSRPHGMLGLSFAKETNLTRKPKTNKADKIAMQPLAQFSKYVGTAPGADRKGLGDVLVVLRAGREWEPERQPSEINGNNYSGDQPAGAGDDNVGVEEPQTEMTQGGKLLAEENMKLKQQLEQALALARKWSDLNAKLQQKLIDPDTSR
jgi:pre-rRNA-processing protein IPI3